MRGKLAVAFSMSASCLLLILLCCNSVMAQIDPHVAVLLQAGDYAGAQRLLERLSPGDQAAQADLLQVLRETGAYEDACKRGDAFIKENPNSSALRLERARVARETGDYALARTLLEAVRSGSSGGVALRGTLSQRRTARAELADLLESLGLTSEADAEWDRLLDEYRQTRVSGAPDLGAIALAAWRRNYISDAKDIFIDATGATPGPDTPLDVLSNFGYLFLEKYNATEALSVFRDCLKINPKYPPALAGIALAKQYESTNEVAIYAHAALEVNPNFVPALNLLAELSFQEEQNGEALRQIQRALAVNPRSLETLSLQAVYYQIAEDAAHLSAVEKQILGINPNYGRLYFTLAENLVMRRKYSEAVDFYRKAVALDSRLYQAYAGMGMNLMRIGDLKEGRAMLERAFESDPFNVWAFNTLDLLDQMDKFKSASSEHFVFKFSEEDARALPPYASKIAEEAFGQLTRRYGFTPEGPIQIEFFPDEGGFAVRTLGLPGLGALGVCFGKVVALDSPRARAIGDFNWGSTFWHEFTHVMTLQMTKHNIPRWYSEGLSVYEEQRARPGWGDDLTVEFVKAYQEGKLLKVSELNAGIMRPTSPEQIGLSYYQAGLFCRMIEEKFGMEKIKQTLQLFAENKPSEEVFQQALGWDAKTLDTQYAAYLDNQLKGYSSRLNFRRLAGQTAEAASDPTALAGILKSNPDDFFANLQLGALMHAKKSYTQAETYLKKAESLFPSFVEPGNAYEILGGMYEEMGREDDALAQYNAWARYDENSVIALDHAADIYQKRKDWANVSRELELSVYIDPYDAQNAAQLGEAAMESGNWAAAIAAFQVLVGLNPPDPAGAHYNLSRAYYSVGKRAEARREILRSLEIAPTFEKAQELLLKLSDRKTP
jgi:tetratricopeptide (TPR) repeat protein